MWCIGNPPQMPTRESMPRGRLADEMRAVAADPACDETLREALIELARQPLQEQREGLRMLQAFVRTCPPPRVTGAPSVVGG